MSADALTHLRAKGPTRVVAGGGAPASDERAEFQISQGLVASRRRLGCDVEAQDEASAARDVSREALPRRRRSSDDKSRPRPKAASLFSWLKRPWDDVEEPPMHRGCDMERSGAHLWKVLRRIFVSGEGPRLMNRSYSWDGWKNECVPVCDLRYTHRCISSSFRQGGHCGRPLSNLVRDLARGAVAAEDFELIAVRFEDKLYSLNNRRLWCLKEHDRGTLKVKVPVLVYEVTAESALVAKFALAFDSQCDGKHVKVRKRARRNADP